LLKNPEQIINKIALIIVNIIEFLRLIFPLGISRFVVLGFFLSISLSQKRLNDIAVFRANIIHKITKTSEAHSKESGSCRIAKENPRKAKGIAKTVWLNFISEKYDFIFVNTSNIFMQICKIPE